MTELPKINTNNIQKFTLQGETKTINELSYFIYNSGKNRDIITLLGGSVPSEYAKVDNSGIKIQILDGSGKAGAAERAKLELEKKGYNVLNTGSITGVRLSSSYIIDKTLKGSFANHIASDIDINKIEKDQDTLSKIDCIIILGTDKDGYF
jgi:hypothetical protein